MLSMGISTEWSIWAELELHVSVLAHGSHELQVLSVDALSIQPAHGVIYHVCLSQTERTCMHTYVLYSVWEARNSPDLACPNIHKPGALRMYEGGTKVGAAETRAAACGTCMSTSSDLGDEAPV